MTQEQALEELKMLTDWDSDPVLTEDELEAILLKNRRATIWQPETAYQVGARVVPPTPDGHWYELDMYATRTPGGLSGAVEPLWPRSNLYPVYRARVRDGEVYWRDLGIAPLDLWNIGQAAADAWTVKATRAANRVTSKEGDVAYSEDQVYKHCMEMARSLAPVGVS